MRAGCFVVGRLVAGLSRVLAELPTRARTEMARAKRHEMRIDM